MRVSSHLITNPRAYQSIEIDGLYYYYFSFTLTEEQMEKISPSYIFDPTKQKFLQLHKPGFTHCIMGFGEETIEYSASVIKSLFNVSKI